MQLTYETQEAVPEDLRESFVEFKDGDQSSWIHKDLAEAKKEAYRFKGDLTQTQQQAKAAAERLKALEDAEAERLKKAEQADLDKKEKEGKHDEILAHFKQTAETEKAELQKQLEELQNSVRAEKKGAVVADLSALGTEATRSTLKRLIDLDLSFDDGNLVVMEDGKATSLTIEQYKAKLPELYPHLVAESHAKGGQANGGNGSGSPSGVNAKAQEAKKKGDLKGFLDASIKFN